MIVDRLAIAYQTSRALAGVLETLGAGLPLQARTALLLRRQVYLVSAILAPAITNGADVAAIGQTLVVLAAALGKDADPASAAPAFALAASGASVAAPSFTSPAMTRAGAFGRALAACVEASLLGQGFVAEARRSFPDQQSAVAARKRIAAAMEGATDRIASAAGQDVMGVLSQVALVTANHIATVAADLRPVVAVETPRSAPSTAIAFALYGDPARAPELVARNGVATSIFMPTRLQALAPKN